MGKNNIEKYSAGYAMLKAFVAFWHNKIFYRKIIVKGTENINPQHHVIFAPNHQNTLMDALAVLFTVKGQPVFLARADIFRKKTMAAILYFLKILPVYRIRDGYANLKGNDEIFLKTVDVIKNRNRLVILPEGNHEGYRRLRQLKKGICRVAFQADEAENNRLNIKIIPVGIEYSDYRKFRQVLTVVYGKPIEVSEYHELYRISPDRALIELRNRLADEMKKQMVHIEPEADYEALDELRNIVNGKYCSSTEDIKLFRDINLLDRLNKLKDRDSGTYENICRLSLGIKAKAAQLAIDYRALERKHSLVPLLAGCVIFIAGLPLFLFGNIINAVFAGIPVWQARKIKDPQFVSSFRFVISAALALLLQLPVLIASLLLFPRWWEGLLFFVSLPVAGLAAWNLYLLYRTIREGFRIRKLRSSQNSLFNILCADYKQLLNIISEI
ncbi:MAG: 1-acyl-sn-glycerol-3-phosphate acyltransferase [Bacteroidales bacterium]|jgi:1-acyl-sn-glycerol-3-phosphate acyltransferase|nr:1-acyl-sn-glycerol-3-phosphate acyltransferase [Bacteroidales bacterium]